MEKQTPDIKKKSIMSMSPSTMTMLILTGCFFLSLIMASGALQWALTILSLLCVAGFGYHLTRHSWEEKKKEKKEDRK